MKLSQMLSLPHCVLLGGLLAAAALSGCQATVGGQTLPSANYLRDDVQFFPAGPEFQLTNQVQAIREYNAAAGGLGAAVVPPAPLP